MDRYCVDCHKKLPPEFTSEDDEVCIKCPSCGWVTSEQNYEAYYEK